MLALLMLIPQLSFKYVNNPPDEILLSSKRHEDEALFV